MWAPAVHVVGCTHVAMLTGRPPPSTVSGSSTYEVPLPVKANEPSVLLYVTPAPKFALAGCTVDLSSHFVPALFIADQA
jgi:hypothetical protein